MSLGYRQRVWHKIKGIGRASDVCREGRGDPSRTEEKKLFKEVDAERIAEEWRDEVN